VKWTPDLLSRVAEMYATKTASQIAEALGDGFTRRQVERAIHWARKKGGEFAVLFPVKENPKRKFFPTPEVLARIFEQREKRMTWDEITEQFDVARTTVRRAAIEAGIADDNNLELIKPVPSKRGSRFSRDDILEIARQLNATPDRRVTEEMRAYFGATAKQIHHAIEKARCSGDAELQSLFPKWQYVPDPRIKERPKRKRNRSSIPRITRAAPSQPKAERVVKLTFSTPPQISRHPPLPDAQPRTRAAKWNDSSNLCCWPMFGAVDRWGRSLFPERLHDPRPGASPLMCGDPREAGCQYCELHHRLSRSATALEEAA
jgi:hypothetical protein